MAQQTRGAVEIVGIGDFHIVRIGRNEGYVYARFFRNGGIIRQSVARRRAMRGKNIVEMKSLRRMRLPQIRAVYRGDNRCVIAALQRIDQWLGRNRAFGIVQSAAHIGDCRDVDQRPRGVVDHDEIRRVPLAKASSPKSHAFLPRIAARYRFGQAQIADSRVIHRAVIGVNHHAHAIDMRMIKERKDAAAQNRLAAKIVILLGKRSAKPRPRSGRDDKSCAKWHVNPSKKLSAELKGHCPECKVFVAILPN